jgi:hypothetical protein
VLAGWGPEETALEAERRTALAEEQAEAIVRARERAISRAGRWLTIAVLVQTLGLIMGAAGAAMSALFQGMGWCISLLGVIPFDEAVRAEMAPQQGSSGAYRFYANCSAIILVFGLQFLAAAYVQGSWLMGTAGLLLGGLSVPSIRWAWISRTGDEASMVHHQDDA